MSSYFSAATNALFGAVSAAADIAKGWGHNIKWVSLKEGRQQSKETGKPAMLVIHKSWCRACKALKPRFASNRDIENLSKHFIMISVGDDDETNAREFKPDGAYIPRILFMDKDGKVMNDVSNTANDTYKYYYAEIDPILDNMKNVLTKTGNMPAKSNSPVLTRNTKTSRR